jgi:hypothetical protein
LEVGNADVELITMIEAYLLFQGSDTLVNQTPLGSRYLALAKILDDLGWDCFLEGRIPVALLDMVRHGQSQSGGYRLSKHFSVSPTDSGCFEMLTFIINLRV